MESWQRFRGCRMLNFLYALGISIFINTCFFVIAAIKKTDVVTDLSYGLSFALTALLLVPATRINDLQRITAGLMVVAWAIRLASYLFKRILTIKVDHRFDGRREDPVKFAKFWILQAFATAVIMLPVIAVYSRPEVHFSLFHAAGIFLWGAGFVIEAIADDQKWRWKRSGNKSFIRSGLWSWSRHPNYFGEILVWWGLWVYALPALSGVWHMAILGPVFITVLLVFISGIPLLEASAEKRFGGDAEYRQYKAGTSILIPLPPRNNP